MLYKSLLLLLFVLNWHVGNAQLRYTFKDTTTPYVPLPASATLVSGSDIWYFSDYLIPLPFTLTFDSSIRLNNMILLPNGISFIAHDTGTLIGDTLSAFVAGGGNFADRGFLTNGPAQSPIRYLTVGTAPNRILKIEIANAGFPDEKGMHGTMDDFANVQIWIYEGRNILEAHYGTSQMTYYNEHFQTASGDVGALVGILQNIDAGGPNFGNYYYLKGAANAPVVATFQQPAQRPNGLLTWPASGQVYRFTPKFNPTGIAYLTASGNIKVYPNPANTTLLVEGAAVGTKVTLYSMTGQPVLQTVLTGGQAIDIAALPAGIYKLMLTNKEDVSRAITVVKE